MSDREKAIMYSAERAFAGCIVTFVNTDTGELRVRHAGGYHYTRLRPDLHKNPDLPRHSRRHRDTYSRSVWDCLRSLLDEADGWGGAWRVRTVSTPQTIYADLRGRKHGGKKGTDMPTPEAIFLGRIGRLDMLETAEAQAA